MLRTNSVTVDVTGNLEVVMCSEIGVDIWCFFRVRVGANPIERPPCPGRMGALEKTIRGFVDREGDEVVKPELGTNFDSLTEAYDFYNLYSWEHGFGIRYGKNRLNPDRRKTMQEIVCGCSVRI